MYLRIVIILNGVSDMSGLHLNYQEAFGCSELKAFYISTRIALGLLHTNA